MWECLGGSQQEQAFQKNLEEPRENIKRKKVQGSQSAAPKKRRVVRSDPLSSTLWNISFSCCFRDVTFITLFGPVTGRSSGKVLDDVQHTIAGDKVRAESRQ